MQHPLGPVFSMMSDSERLLAGFVPREEADQATADEPLTHDDTNKEDAKG